MLDILAIETEDQKAAARLLLRDYFGWLIETMNREFNTGINPASIPDEALFDDSKFRPPKGRMLLALNDGSPAGLVCLRKISDETGEVKRMYVPPTFRGKGVGKALLDRLCAEARQAGYVRLRLDTAPFMQSAHAVYRSMGFHDIDPYPESEAPAEFHDNWLFMELLL